MKKKNVNQLVRFDNSLKEIASNLLRPRKRMQQYIHLYIMSFIKNFHCRYELNKAEHNKTSAIASVLTTILKEV